MSFCFYFLPTVPSVITDVMIDDVMVCSTGWNEPKVTAFIMVGETDPWSTYVLYMYICASNYAPHISHCMTLCICYTEYGKT